MLEIEKSNMTDEKIEMFSREETKCRECSFQGLPIELLECDKCQDPTRLEIYGANLWVMKQGEGTGSHLVVEDWEADDIPEDYKGKVEGWDFQKFLAYPSHEAACTRLGVANPFTGGAQTADRGRSVPYGQQQGNDAGSESTSSGVDYD